MTPLPAEKKTLKHYHCFCSISRAVRLQTVSTGGFEGCPPPPPSECQHRSIGSIFQCHENWEENCKISTDGRTVPR